MNADRLLKLYDKVAEAPDAIERLRRFVLDLAVRGKLVEQDPADEPASELVKRIAAEKVRLVKAGKVRNKPDLPPVDPEGQPHPIPNTWRWVRFANIVDFSAGRTPSRNNSSFWNTGDYPWVSIADIENGKIVENTKETVSEKARKVAFKSEPERAGTMIMSFKLTIGKIARLGVPAFHNEAIISIRPHLAKLDPYLFKVLPDLARDGKTKGAIKGATLNRESLSNILIPLAPFAEQRRIVAKVEELMALLDRLEAARVARKNTRDRLTTASLARLTAPDTDPEAFPDHARFALAALPSLTARSDQIKLLRQSILNLAVRGKLVEQNRADEPALELLKRMSDAKAAAKRETGDRRIKDAPRPDPSTLPMVLPSGWSVESFENLFLFIDYRGRTPPKTEGGIPLITAKNVRMGTLNREPREYVAKKTYAAWMTRGLPRPGDLFFTTEAPLANICMNNITEPFALAQRVVCFQPFATINTRFLMFAIMSDVMQELIDEHATGLTAKGIKTAKLKPLPLPIPPLDEQSRIVDRVRSLMVLCDRLEAAFARADTRRGRLLNAVLQGALGAQSTEREAA